MTTTSPSWFDAYPSTFPDTQPVYEETVPRQYPRGLYDPETDEGLFIKAQGQIFNWVAQALTWIKQRYWPDRDDSELFLARWETVLGLAKRATATLRQNAIIAKLRHRTTATSAQVKAIFAPLFGETDPAEISFLHPSATEIAAVDTLGADTYARWANYLHIYHTDETTEPDLAAADDAIRQTQPAHQHWTVGQFGAADGSHGGSPPTCGYGSTADGTITARYNRCVYAEAP